MTLDCSEHFTREQLQCPCGCGLCAMDEHLLAALEKLQALAQTDLVITCACRCLVANRAERGVSKRAHLDGRAVDFKVPGLSLQQMYDLAEQVAEFREGGIGVHDDGTVHVDVRVNRSRWGRVHGLYLGLESSRLLERW